MIKQLFSFDFCCSISDSVIEYFDCVLKAPIGDYKIGTKVPCLAVDWENGVLEIGVETFKLTLKVG